MKNTVGVGSIATLKPDTNRSKQPYKWTLSHAQINLLLKQINPYLIVMRAKSEVVLTYYDSSDHKATWEKFNEAKDAPVLNTTVMSAAYAAGFIDAEGSIELHRTKTRLGRQRSEYSVGLRVANTMNPSLVAMQAYFGVGNLIVRNNGPRRQPIWRWQLKAKQAEVVLSQVQPFLIAKTIQCTHCLEARSVIRKGEQQRHTAGHIGKTNTPPAILEKLNNLWGKVRILNHRGIECPA
jgi:hypothetical protein